MPTSPIIGFEIPYKLLRRFESLIESIFALNATIQQTGFVRYKPLFSNYISCVEVFKSHFSDDYDQLNLEDVKLFDGDGKELFTGDKVSTILHQAQAIVGVLKGMLPPALVENPGGTTILVSSQASSQASSEATAEVHFNLIMEGLSQAIQESEMDQQSKDSLNSDINQLKSLRTPDKSKLETFATKFARKLQEVGENVAIGIIGNWLRNQSG